MEYVKLLLQGVIWRRRELQEVPVSLHLGCAQTLHLQHAQQDQGKNLASFMNQEQT